MMKIARTAREVLRSARAVPAWTVRASRCAATAPPGAKDPASPSPREHAEADLAKVYTISPETLKEKFGEGIPGLRSHAAARELVHGSKVRQLRKTRRTAAVLSDFDSRSGLRVVLREPSQRVISDIQATGGKRSFLLDGHSGMGKSYELFRVVHWCKESDFVVVPLFAPRSFLMPEHLLEPSEIREGMFDVPNLTAFHLHQIGLANGERLADIPVSDSHREMLHSIASKETDDDDSEAITQDHEKERQELIERAGRAASVADVVAIGAKWSNVASASHHVVLESVKQQTSHRVVYAVDEFNALFEPSKLPVVDGKRLTAHDLTLTAPFCALDGELVGEDGVFVAATSYATAEPAVHRKRGPARGKHAKKWEDPLPISSMRKLLAEHAGVEYLNVPRLSKAEFDNLVGTFLEADMFTVHQPIEEQYVAVANAAPGVHVANVTMDVEYWARLYRLTNGSPREAVNMFLRL